MEYNNGCNAELLERYDSLVKGHTYAKKVIVNMLNRILIRHHQKWVMHLPKSEWLTPNKVLLMGESGCGKTFLMECAQKLVDFPMIRLDATQLNPTGAGGGIKSETVKTMIRDHAKELVFISKGKYCSVDGTIDRMVVFVDEVDKLAHSWESSGNWNKHVQSNFLTLFEDSTEFAGVTWVFAGAFTGLQSNNKSSSIGFNNPSQEQSISSHIDDDLIKYGLITELVGRITHIAQLDKFSKKDYKEILLQVLIPKKIMELMHFNVFSLDMTEEDIDKLVDKAMLSGQGIRYLKRELDKLTLDLEFNYENRPSSLQLEQLVENFGNPDDIRYEYF